MFFGYPKHHGTDVCELYNLKRLLSRSIQWLNISFGKHIYQMSYGHSIKQNAHYPESR
jgi:hypothetical protein